MKVILLAAAGLMAQAATPSPVEQAQAIVGDAPATPQVLVLADVFGATPCNLAQKLVDGARSRLVAGVNLPMLLRAVSYRNEPLDALVQRAMAGGTAGVMQVAVAAPQNQARRKHSDQDLRDHQQ